MIPIIFFGTPEFALPSLRAVWRLPSDTYRFAAVVTAPDKPAGRKHVLTSPPAKMWAETHSIKVLQPDTLRSEAWVQKILDLNPALGVIASYGHMIPRAILQAPRYGILNVHPSLLPHWRGPAPIQFALLHGDQETGITLMRTDEELDHGPILAQKKLPIAQNDTTATLSQKLAALGAALLAHTIPRWVAREIVSREQDHTQATFTKLLAKKDGKIDWHDSAEAIERKIRAFSPWPGTYTLMDGKKIKILAAKIYSPHQSYDERLGTVVLGSNDECLVQCGRGILAIVMAQLEGKTPISGEAFLRGRRHLIGHRLGS